MCGIVGILKARPSNNIESEKKTLVAMRDRMVHRGPDDAGIWTDGRCILGHRRLSIIDLSPAGHQPMGNEDGSVQIVFNGEVYNHAEVRPELESRGHKYKSHSDTETIIHGYEQWGLKTFEKFNGMWGVAIYDNRDRDKPQLHLVRDRIGIKPIYITRTPAGDWLFASEIKALLAHPDVKAETDLTALWHYLTFIVAPAPLTLFRNIFKVPAGWSVTIDHNGRARASQWWDCKPDASEMFDPAEVSEDKCAEMLLDTLRKSIKRRMVSDVPFGVLLSGGIDSSMNVALMSELMDRPVTTFSIGYEGHESYNEFQFARRIAKRYKTDHHEVLINREQMQAFLPTLMEVQDEPIADNVCIPLYFLSKLVRDSGTTVVQVGEGADENWLGYWWCEHFRQKYQDVYQPNFQAPVKPSWLGRFFGNKAQQTVAALPLPGNLSEEDRDTVERARAGQEMFWCGAACWWGSRRKRLTPDSAPFQQTIDCPIEGLLDDSHRTLDSHDIVRHYLGPLDGRVPEPSVLYKIPYMEHKLRLAEHLLMRVDKCTMAHSIEARVPFLDYEMVDLARRVPAAYKLKGGIGKHLLKKVAAPFLDEDMIYRKKQGFGAPMDEWFKEPEFGRRAQDDFENSFLVKQGLVDRDYVREMFQSQMASGGWSFHLWTLMNAVYWHDRWVG
ncbi:MAG: asparagine synthase (glutamine-hydrolyzing) [Planctomycetes bacterium]|nr:asparagine synthase (glutamine-hydrolyzing) [Planctomycetota bacterium]